MPRFGGARWTPVAWLVWAAPVWAQAEATTPPGWFNTDRVNALVLLVGFCAALLLYIRSAARGKSTYIRPLPGLEAVEDGVGRATEMGRPVLFIPGTGDVDMAETLAGLAVLGRIEGGALLPEVLNLQAAILSAAGRSSGRGWRGTRPIRPPPCRC